MLVSAQGGDAVAATQGEFRVEGGMKKESRIARR